MKLLAALAVFEFALAAIYLILCAVLNDPVYLAVSGLGLVGGIQGWMQAVKP